MADGDTSGMSKMLLMLGAVMLFINLIIPGANPAWANLAVALSTGPNFPSSPAGQDPYIISEHNFTYSITSNSTDERPMEMGGTDSALCPFEFDVNGVSGDFYKCVTTSDAGGSYVKLSPLGSNPYYTGFNTTSSGIVTGGTTYNLIRVSGQIVCQNTATADTMRVQIQLWNWDVNPGVVDLALFNAAGEGCQNRTFHPTVPEWQTLNYSYEYRNGFEVGGVDPHDIENDEIVLQQEETGFVRVSYVSVSVTYVVFNFESSVTCPDIGTNPIGYIGCTLDQTWRWFSDFIGFLAGGAIIIGQWIFAALEFIFNVVTNFIFGLIYAFIWLMAIPAPYSPPAIIQGGIDILVIAVLGNLFLVFAKLLRGTGTVG